ncbi:Ssadh [Bugula neritina]|uniref:Succinate-semialdehyde dehydrogenase, mitochondrial n=1 Tax=Bugula neritina TaxID=10212 RepID=A0A7J7JQ75_BUGNE|nr:Ssadh [Bugula neritina]
MSLSLRRSESYINGEWVKGRAEKLFQVFNPKNGSIIGEVYDLDAEDTKAAVDAAYEAFGPWSKKTAKERSALLYKWYSLILENIPELGEMLTEENGKPLAEGKGEIMYAASFLDWYSAEARRVYGETIEFPVTNRRSIIRKEPVGVAGIIVPWNFPAGMLTRKVGPALAAGCTVVVKSPEDTPYIPTALVELANRAGIPRGVLNIVSCSRSNAAGIGQLFSSDPKVSTVSFTGSCEVGKRISLELGGLAPLIVFDSADLSKVVSGTLFAKFRNCGQACISAQNFFIQEGIYDKAVEEITKLTKSLKMGDPMDSTTSIGPLINSRGLEKVERLVNDAKSKGATVICGGSRATDVGELYFQPTLLTGITEDMDILHQEVFGPVINVIKFKTEEEAIRRANDSERGLASYFYSSDISQCYRVMEALQAGLIGCNDTTVSSAETPFGGYKQSGIGREGGKYGMDEFLQIKMCAIGIDI